MAGDDADPKTSSSPIVRFLARIDLLSIVGIALIFVFAVWFVRHYAFAIS